MPHESSATISAATASTAFGRYRLLFATPGARAFTIGNLIARLPMGMFSVSAVIMIAGARGSYALAGAVTATGLAATAVVGPWTARLVDRYGQARTAVPATLLAASGSACLLLCVHYDAPDWTLFACYAATATTPNTGGMSRARWAHLLRGDPAALHTANSFEQAADELCFMLGPVIAAFLCSALFPEAGTLVGVASMVTGVLVFAAQRATEPPATPAPPARAPPSGTPVFPRCSPSSSPPARSSAPSRSPPSPSPTRMDTARQRARCWPSRRPGRVPRGSSTDRSARRRTYNGGCSAAWRR